jgi:BirA family biotin operon repressor/biotin-[acetyl-CoA-carboxylase] ligase
MTDSFESPSRQPSHVGKPHWGAEALWEALEPVLPGLSIEIVERLDSTNTELLERLRRAARMQQEGRGGRASDDVQPQLLVAIHQTAGRGRLGRRWHATPGASLTFSISLTLERADWSGLSLAVGLALAEALDPPGGRVALKWPNDLMLHPLPDEADRARHPLGRKLGGILIESVSVGTRRLAVIGVGLNIAVQRLMAGDMSSAHVSEFQPDATAQGVLATIVPPLARALVAFERDGFAPLAEAYGRRDVLRGCPVRTSDPTVPEGVADGVGPDGTLVVIAHGQVHRIVSGEVSVRSLLP